jgi:hypothetical protein
VNFGEAQPQLFCLPALNFVPGTFFDMPQSHKQTHVAVPSFLFGAHSTTTNLSKRIPSISFKAIYQSFYGYI